jgi:asparagine synthase (glutamine-hydrolysing)
LSGFAVLYERIKTPVDPGVLIRMMDSLSHRGFDGKNMLISDPVALGHQHFWTTPEEVEELQPLRLVDLPYTIVLDGRLDNRSEIINRLSMNNIEGSTFSDASLILRAYSRWGTDCFHYLIGEFALVIWDSHSSEIVCARDAVGDRTLFYSFNRKQLLIASEPWAVAAGIGTQVEINDRAVAYHFSLRVPEDGQTLFKGIFELLPAHWMKVKAEDHRIERYWEPFFQKPSLQRSEADFVEEFRDLLTTSVKCRMRSVTSPCVMMSGGLDSTSIASLAAQMVAPEPLTMVSYVFDDFTSCDERKYINAFRDRFGTRAVQIPCDELWPYKTWPDWPLDPNWPPANPYRLILERTYERVKEEGLRVMLSGMYGDNLYFNSQNWLADLFLNGRIRDLNQEFALLVKTYGLKRVFNPKFLRHTIKDIILRIPGIEVFRRTPQAPYWVTDYSASLLNLQKIGRKAEKQAGLFDLRDAAGNSYEIYNTNKHGIELRTPYRDRRLLEFVLQLPGYLLYSQGITKRILRLAMKRDLPELILSRNDHTNLLPIYNYGVKQRFSEIQTNIKSENAGWKEYVKPEVVVKEWQTEITRNNDGANTTIPSLCVFYEIWYKSLLEKASQWRIQ